MVRLQRRRILNQSVKLIIALVVLLGHERTFAQSSPALDPDWIELQPEETFFGVWANQFTGFYLRTVKPFTKEIPEDGIKVLKE